MIKITIPNLNKELDDVSQEVREVIYQASVATAFNAVTSLQQQTPIDTGRARNSWNISTDTKDFKKDFSAISVNSLLATTALNTLDSDGLSVDIYLTNSAPYINELNRGKSDQAPSRFIERTLLQFYDPDGVIVDEIKLPGDDKFNKSNR
jgi:hypothetical protein